MVKASELLSIALIVLICHPSTMMIIQILLGSKMGETVTHKKSIDLSDQANKIAGENPCFAYFLDGSR